MRFGKGGIRKFAIPFVVLLLIRLTESYLLGRDYAMIGGPAEIVFVLATGWYLLKKGFDVIEAGVGAGLLSVAAGIVGTIIVLAGVSVGVMPAALIQSGVNSMDLGEFIGGYFQAFFPALVIGFITSFIFGAIGAAAASLFSRTGKAKGT